MITNCPFERPQGSPLAISASSNACRRSRGSCTARSRAQQRLDTTRLAACSTHMTNSDLTPPAPALSLLPLLRRLRECTGERVAIGLLDHALGLDCLLIAMQEIVDPILRVGEADLGGAHHCGGRNMACPHLSSWGGLHTSHNTVRFKHWIRQRQPALTLPAGARRPLSQVVGEGQAAL